MNIGDGNWEFLLTAIVTIVTIVTIGWSGFGDIEGLFLVPIGRQNSLHVVDFLLPVLWVGHDFLCPPEEGTDD